MKRKCRTCNIEFEGESWKKQCYSCYKNFKGMPRISSAKSQCGRWGVFILSHPSCTKEEVDEFIKKTYGSVNDPSNWGAVEVTGRNAKVWWNCQNDD
jgi:hypothetical protein